MVFLNWDAYDASLVVVGIIIVRKHSKYAPTQGCHPSYVERPPNPISVLPGAVVIFVGLVGILHLSRRYGR